MLMKVLFYIKYITILNDKEGEKIMREGFCINGLYITQRKKNKRRELQCLNWYIRFLEPKAGESDRTGVLGCSRVGVLLYINTFKFLARDGARELICGHIGQSGSVRIGCACRKMQQTRLEDLQLRNCRYHLSLQGLVRHRHSSECCVLCSVLDTGRNVWLEQYHFQILLGNSWDDAHATLNLHRKKENYRCKFWVQGKEAALVEGN